MRYCHFNSHPHEEDDILGFTFRTKSKYFNSHPHEEDDKDDEEIWNAENDFNSHPHEEDDFFRPAGFSAVRTFQLTSSRRG